MLAGGGGGSAGWLSVVRWGRGWSGGNAWTTTHGATSDGPFASCGCGACDEAFRLSQLRQEAFRILQWPVTRGVSWGCQNMQIFKFSRNLIHFSVYYMY
jgi:hypothetical protein